MFLKISQFLRENTYVGVSLFNSCGCFWKFNVMPTIKQCILKILAAGLFIDRYLRVKILFIFQSNFHVNGVALYGVRNIFSLEATEIFHFGGHSGGFS